MRGAANNTSSSSSPACGSMAHPRPKKTRGSNEPAHLPSFEPCDFEPGDACMVEVSRLRWPISSGPEISTGRKVISIYQGAGSFGVAFFRADHKRLQVEG